MITSLLLDKTTKKLDSIWWTTRQRSEQLKWVNKDLHVSVAL